MTKKISKVIVYYEDGTYEEVKAGVSDLSGQPNKKDVSPSPVTPDFRPDYTQIRELRTTPYQPPTWNIPLNYTVTSDPCNMEMPTWTFTSTGNADNLNKYTITSTGNGNVDLSK